MEQKKYKSWALWVGVAGAVYVILNAFDLVPIDEPTWNILLNAIGAILMAFGIVNNPNSKDSF